MKAKSIKIYVSKEIHVVLSQIQADLKEKLQKKVALAEILFEFAEKGIKNFSKANFNLEKEEEVETIAITIHISEKFSAILNEIQADLKEKLQKKVALAEILFELVKKGMQNDFTQNEIANNDGEERFTQNINVESSAKSSFTQNEKEERSAKNSFTQNEKAESNEKTDSTQNSISNTQNLKPFIQNLIVKQLQKTQNEYKLDAKLENDYYRIERKEKKLRDFEQDLKNEREELFVKRRELLKSQEIVNAKLFETREKDSEIRLLEYKMKKLGENYIEKHKIQMEEVNKLEKENNNDKEKYEDRISILRDEKRNLLDELFEFKNALEDLKFSNKSLTNTIKDLGLKDKEKTILDQFEPFLPAILTMLVLVIKDKKIVETIKKEFLAIFKKPK